MDTANTRTNLIQRTTDLAMHIVSAYVRPGDTVIDATCGNGHDTLQLARMLQSSKTPSGRKTNGIAGNLFAFDLLPEAIEHTRALLLQNGLEPSQITFDLPKSDSNESVVGNIRLICCGHEHMADYLRRFNTKATSEEPDAVASSEDPDSTASFREFTPPTSPENLASAIVFNLGYLPGGDKTATTRADTTLTAVRDALGLLRVNGLVCITIYSGHPEGAAEKKALLQFAEGLDSKQWHVSYISMYNQQNDPPEILLISRKR